MEAINKIEMDFFKKIRLVLMSSMHLRSEDKGFTFVFNSTRISVNDILAYINENIGNNIVFSNYCSDNSVTHYYIADKYKKVFASLHKCSGYNCNIEFNVY